MVTIRIIITLVISVAGLLLGGIVSGLVGIFLVGVEAYDRAFTSRPWGPPALLSVGFYVTCTLAAGFFAWRASANWIKWFLERQVKDDGDIYFETGGARYREALGAYLKVSWPFARLTASPEQLELKVRESCFVFGKHETLQLKRFHGIFFSGLEIVDFRGNKFVFWSFNTNRLVAKIRSLGFKVDERHTSTAR